MECVPGMCGVWWAGGGGGLLDERGQEGMGMAAWCLAYEGRYEDARITGGIEPLASSPCGVGIQAPSDHFFDSRFGGYAVSTSGGARPLRGHAPSRKVRQGGHAARLFRVGRVVAVARLFLAEVPRLTWAYGRSLRGEGGRWRRASAGVWRFGVPTGR